MSTYDEALAAKAVALELLSEADVCGVGIAVMDAGGFGVKVNLRRTTTLLLPACINGVPVVVDVVGEIRALGGTAGEEPTMSGARVECPGCGWLWGTPHRESAVTAEVKPLPLLSRNPCASALVSAGRSSAASMGRLRD